MKAKAEIMMWAIAMILTVWTLVFWDILKGVPEEIAGGALATWTIALMMRGIYGEV